VRRAQQEAFQSLNPHQGSYTPPSREECSSRQWEVSIDDAATVRLQYNIWHHDGRLVDFVVNIQVLTAEGWETVEYVDCCHGHCHHHPRSGTPPRTIVRLDVVADVQQAFGQVDPIIEERLRIIRDRGEG
jgi:hypothetical protein